MLKMILLLRKKSTFAITMNEIEIKNCVFCGDASLAYIDERIPAGFPSPSQGVASDAIDLNRELIANPSSTFCARVMGDSMVEYEIFDGDLLIVDKSLQPVDGCVAVCFVDGEFTVKCLSLRGGKLMLVPGNKSYSPIEIPEDSNFQVWGIVTHIIKNVISGNSR